MVTVHPEQRLQLEDFREVHRSEVIVAKPRFVWSKIAKPEGNNLPEPPLRPTPQYSQSTSCRTQIRPTLRRHFPFPLPPPARGSPEASPRVSLPDPLFFRDEDREAKKEAFRKYLESSGVLDTLTKVLVALYEESDKPSSAVEFVQQKLGGPSISDYEKLKAEKLDLQLKYNELLDTHKETCRQLEELKTMKYGAPWN
ncbi:hypothetical protein ACP4OV_012237 [Aristida adscensionis]